MVNKWDKYMLNTKKEMINEIKNMADRGIAPLYKDFIQETQYNQYSIKNLFGSYREFAEEAGLRIRGKTKIEDRIDIDIDDNADGWVYTILLELEGIGEIFYVGKTTDVFSRLSNHMSKNGQNHKRLPARNRHGKMVMKNYHPSDIDFKNVVNIQSFTKIDGEKQEEFNQRLKYQERMRWHEVAIEENTTKVFGGR